MGVCLLNPSPKKDCKNRCRMKAAYLKFHFFKMHFFVFSSFFQNAFFRFFFVFSNFHFLLLLALPNINKLMIWADCGGTVHMLRVLIVCRK